MAGRFLIPWAFFLTAFPSLAWADNWGLDRDESYIHFSGVQIGQPFQGEFQDFTARICFDEDDPAAASITLEINMDSISTGIPERDEILAVPAWLNVQKFPTATFQIKNLKNIEIENYHGESTLTMKGVEKNLTVPFILDLENNAATGTLIIDRRDFNVGEGRWGETEQWVGFDIEINFQITAIPTGGACDT